MDLHREIRETASPLHSDDDLEPLLALIGEARYVLLGEASHGTHEFYEWRARLTRRLIAERDFDFVAVEGDWPDCYRVHSSLTHDPEAPADPGRALQAFDRWPTWMWANREVAGFTRWLRRHNERRLPERRVGFYGLDVYSLWDSLRVTLDYLRTHRPAGLDAALQAIRCFEPYAGDPQAYARATQLVPAGCEDAVVRLLAELQTTSGRGKAGDDEAHFNAEQNALAASGAEAYYRALMRGGADSWNVRDRHMAATLDRLMEYHGRRRHARAKCVVWAHNTHVGDARWTDMARAGMVNLGQLVREQHADDGVVLVGFGAYEGRVVAAEYWGGRTQLMKLPPARPESFEALLHEALPDRPAALFRFRDQPHLSGRQHWASVSRGHRAVGVVYDPRSEHRGNYVPTVLSRRYDAFLWFDRTGGVGPLHGVHPHGAELEAWPSGQ